MVTQNCFLHRHVLSSPLYSSSLYLKYISKTFLYNSLKLSNTRAVSKFKPQIFVQIIWRTIPIPINFHTKFICDRYFGLLKTLYHKTRINTIDDVAKVVMRSIKNSINKAIQYQSGEGWTYYDFTHHIPHLKQYQHFLFRSNEPGEVFCRRSFNSEYETFTLLKPSNSFDPLVPAPILNAQPVSYTRQKYLYDEVR